MKENISVGTLKYLKQLSAPTLDWHNKRKGAKTPGFTLVELMVVVAVIAILATVVVVAYNSITGNAVASTAISGSGLAASKIEKYKLQNSGNYPPDLTTVGLTAPSGSTFSYTNTGTGYCFVDTVGTVSYYVSDANSQPKAGSSCPGYQICPSGFIPVPGNPTFGTSNFCTMKYEARQASGTVPVSQASGTPWVNITQANAIAYSPNVAGCSGCHLMTEAEWMTIAANVLRVGSNWSGGSYGSGYIYSGHNDNAPANALTADTNDSNGYLGETNTGGNQRRTLTLTNGQVIWDFAGNVWEWTNATIAGGAQPGVPTDGSFTGNDWNNSAMTWGSFPSSSRPSAVAQSVGAFLDEDIGSGEIYSYIGDSTVSGYLRGGAWYNGTLAGIFGLGLHIAPTSVGSSIGFRVSD